LSLQIIGSICSGNRFAVQDIKPCVEIVISLGDAIGEKMPQIETRLGVPG